jgi:predicted cupin superfamily sugar epimerase
MERAAGARSSAAASIILMKEPLPDLRDPTLHEATVRAALDLMPHPEGGHYRELWRDRPEAGGRGAASAILFLLAAGERSHWHRVDASEIWTWQAGAPLALGLCYPGGERRTIKLGPYVGNGEVFQGVVPPHAWQQAASAGAWTLVSCIVAPAFQFEGFELAPPGWFPAS